MHPKLTETFAKYETIILVGGGTGGHIQPILNVSDELKDKKLLWIGGRDSNEEQEAKKTKIDFKSVSTLKLSTTLSPKVLLYPFVLLNGIFESRKILQTSSSANQQTCIFSKGGPGSVAVGIAAWSLKIPLYIHESDTIPGRSNRVLGKFATKIFLGFESVKTYFNANRCEVVGQILHPVFSTKTANQQTSKSAINWKTDKPHILVICGSQGAKSIFEAIISQFSGSEDYEWIIALGKLNEGMKKDFKKMKNIQALEWISQEDIAFLLENTDLTITRGSATTLAEIDTFGVRKIIIPLPCAADNHQYWNAKEYEKNGDTLLEQKDIKELRTVFTKTI